MYKQLIVGFDMSNLMLAGEIIFFVIFAASLFWVFRKGSRSFYEELARLPLEDGRKGK